MAEITIGMASKLTEIKIPTIRYYEEIGLISPRARTESNRRLYAETDLSRLRFIRHARELGFDIDAIRTMIDLQAHPEQSCSEIDQIANKHLVDVNRRIAGLQALKGELSRMIEGCNCGRIDECRIIEVLQDHGQCKNDHSHMNEKFK